MAGKSKQKKTRGRKGKRKTPMYKYPFNVNGQNVMMVYKENATLSTPVGADKVNQFGLNDMFDLDVTNDFNNKQPLYFDQLLSSVGPYYRFSVQGWKTKITITNASAYNLEIGYAQALDTTSANSIAEIEDWPGGITRQITPATGGKPSTTIVKRSTIVGATGDKGAKYDNTWQGLYNSSPANIVYGNLVVHETGGNVAQFKVHLEHVFKVRVWGTRAQAS